MEKGSRAQKGAALVEYVLVLPLVLLLFLGTLEIFRLISVKQSLRSGLKQALPCLNHWRDYPLQCDPLGPISHELERNPFTIRLHRLEVRPRIGEVQAIRFGEVFEVIVEAEVEFGFLYPFSGGPTITLRETASTFMDSAPEYFQLNVETPFPVDPGALP